MSDKTKVGEQSTFQGVPYEQIAPHDDIGSVCTDDRMFDCDGRVWLQSHERPNGYLAWPSDAPEYIRGGSWYMTQSTIKQRCDLLSLRLVTQKDEYRRATDEAIRLWRIATCQKEQLSAINAEIEALGTATPEACRAIDAWNHRLDKCKAVDEIAALRTMVRTAQDASVIAITERRQFEDRDTSYRNMLRNNGFECGEREHIDLDATLIPVLAEINSLREKADNALRLCRYAEDFKNGRISTSALWRHVDEWKRVDDQEDCRHE